MSDHKNMFYTFVSENQFDLHSYLTYLFINECKEGVVNELEQGHINQ
ncbi:hypothetical protein P4661_29080 [Priestia megaterium]|nr:hypothetical protein [Priestia megaterium]MDH3161304.1 hypothetical protein [Priestia megaterium]MED4116890.1 hypothetical protein [Priestia megaterium]